MMKQIGSVRRLTVHPVKSMAGIDHDVVQLGWHGLDGDRRMGVRQVDSSSSFPWLTASRLPQLLLYRPCPIDQSTTDSIPSTIVTPNGQQLEPSSQALREEIGHQAGFPVELMHIKHGIFDDALISLIASNTVNHVCQQANVEEDTRRFRANIVVDNDDLPPFAEDEWVGNVLMFGEDPNGPAIHVTKLDERCKMIGLDPNTAEYNPEVLKTAVRLNNNYAGVYATVVRAGTIRSNDPVFLRAS